MKKKIDFFSYKMELKSFFLLIKPTKEIYTNAAYRELVEIQIDNLLRQGFGNIEISWSDNENWFNYVSNLKLKFPKINLGSASIISRKAIDQSIKIGLKYSMMKVWDKNLLNYSNSKNHLLIPGIKNLKELKEAVGLNCKIIKIYPVKDNIQLINLCQYKNIEFIAAGGLSISDIPFYKSLGYKAIVIGDKGFKNKVIDPKIYEWLKEKSN
tara:strand:- start:1 stop:633 length:633 start_codon:yes stop_codon:yes gene_type:complete